MTWKIVETADAPSERCVVFFDSIRLLNTRALRRT
jgi:hypothetical protein